MIYNLPDSWIQTEIEHCTTILDNFRKPVNAKERSNKPGIIPYYGATGQAGWIDNYIFNEELILLGEDGAPFFDKKKNVAFQIEGKSWVNNHAHVLKAKEDITLNSFLLHYLNYFDYTDFVGGTTRLKLNQGDLKRIPFPLPPLAEQKRIVAKLDLAFGHLDTLKVSLARIPELLKSFRQAVLTQAVTGKLTEDWREGNRVSDKWKEELTKDCCAKVQSGGTPKSGFTSEGIPFLKVYNIVNQKIDFNYRSQFISEEAHNHSMKKSILIPGDVIMNIVGPPLNKIALVPHTFKEWNHNQAITLFRAKPYLLNTFLYYYFCEGTSVKSLHNETKGVVGQVNISLSQCREFRIPIPSIDEQSEIVTRVEALFAKADAIEAQYLSLKEKIDKLPQALLAKAFRGELVPQDPNDEPAAVLLEKIQKEMGKLVKKGKR